jgi:NADH-quinone oxidoreductase subunit C
METVEQLRDRLLACFPGAAVAVVTNPGAAAEHSLLLGAAQAREIAEFLRDDPVLRLDYCSNVTGIDWPEKEITDTVKTTMVDPAGGPAKVVETKTVRVEPGYLEAVYFLYSMAQKHGPVIVRLRTANRTDAVSLPSLTPVWRSCDFQEREIFDLYGIVFTGHPDLRRLLLWDEFVDHPMRKDYVEPDDYEWEPTAHGDVLARAQAHQAAVAAASAPSVNPTPSAS